MKPSTKFLSFIFTGSLIISMIGCSFSDLPFLHKERRFPDDPRVDQSFLTSQPCEAPCWYNLRIGESNLDNAQTIVSELPFVDKSTISESKFADGGFHIDFNCSYSVNDFCGSLSFTSDGKLYMVYLPVMYELSIQSVIDHLGPPRNFFAIGPSHNVCEIYIFWPERDIRLRLEGKPAGSTCKDVNNGKIDLSSQVDYLIYSEIDADLIDQGIPWSDITPP
jgi:hypothetical protein